MTEFIDRPLEFHHGVTKSVRQFDAKFGRHSDRWLPPRAQNENTPPSWITPFPGEYLINVETPGGEKTTFKNFSYDYFRHWITQKKTFRACSAPMIRHEDPYGNVSYDYKKEGCEICQANMNNVPGVRRAAIVQCLNVIVWGSQHFIETNEQGKNKTYWELCSGEGCRRCQSGIPVVHFRRAYWPVGEWDMAELGRVSRQLGTTCVNGCRGVNPGDSTLVPSGTVCPHCGLIHVALEDQPMSQPEWQEHVRTPITCPECNTRTHPKICVQCTKCKGEDYSRIWDVKIGLLSRQGKNPNLWDLRCEGTYALTSEDREAIKDSLIPYDFAEINAPPSLDEQRVLLYEESGIPGQGAPPQQHSTNPTGHRPQSPQHYVPYGQPQAPGNGGPPAGAPSPNYFRPPEFNSGQR